MNSALKQRLVGAIVLVALAVIFVPSFLREKQVEPVNTETLIPDPPERETMTFESPTPPDDVEPAPAPETMFMPDDSREQPVADSLEQARAQEASTPESASGADTGETSSDGTGEDGGESDSDLPEAASEEGAWVVQVASLSSADSARKLRDRLQDEGHRAYVREASTSSGQVSRVYIGPKIERAQAEAIKAAVDESLKVESLILRFEP